MADNRLKAVATARAYDQGGIANLDDAMTRRLVASTVLTESYGGDLDPINRLGYVGRYQSGAAWLADAGYINPERYHEARAGATGAEWERGGGQLRFMRDPANWNNGLSLDRYVASDDLQDRAFRTNSNRSYQQALRNGILDENASPETVAGFLKARHLAGYEGARNAVQGGRTIRDENGTSNYDYFHDITRNRDGLNEVMDRTRQPVAPTQATTPAQSITEPDVARQPGGPGSFNDVMRTMLPPQNGVSPHITSDFGPRRVSNGSSNPQGVDFNYIGGQSGINLRHPTVHAPVSGTVEMPANSPWNTVGIRDSAGNLHQVLHLDSRSVRNGQPITAGDAIGTMGNTNNRDPRMAQHVHYQIRDASGATVDPERFWNNRQVQSSVTPEADSRNRPPVVSGGAATDAMADGVLRHGERSEDIRGMQRSLNELGIRDANGRPLVDDARFGDRTREAVTAYQVANGLHVDGIAGRETLGSIGSRLPPGRVDVGATVTGPIAVTNPAHADHALYSAFRGRLPADVPDNAVANVMLHAKQAGIDRPDALRDVAVQGNTAFVVGTTPGFRAMVDLNAPAPSMEQVSARLAAVPEQAQQPPQPQVAIGGR